MKISKSPSSPSRPLSDCFSVGMKLYEIFPNTSFDRTQIANVLGMSLKSSSFKGLLSDLKQYGLIEKTPDDEFAITKALKEYSIADESEKNAARFKFATQPELFTRIIDNQGNHLPDSSTLAGILTARFEFTKERALKVAKALRGSLEWANAIDAKGNVIKPTPKSALASKIDIPAETSTGALATQTEGSETLSSTNEHNEWSTTTRYAHITETPLVLEVSLERGRKIRIEYPADTMEKEAKKACAVLNAVFAG